MANYGICSLTLIPMRKEAAERSEMVSQVLFGETFEIVERQNSWSHIKTQFDEYLGWVSNSMITRIEPDVFQLRQNKLKVILKDPICKVSSAEATLPVAYLAGGSTLLEENGEIVIDGHILQLGNHAELFHTGGKVDIISTALQYLNTPYLWGGRTAFGIDCSGFTQVVFKSNGITFPRDAYQQAELGKEVNIKDIQPCDLAFFENDHGRIMHVGIVLQNSEILHSSGKVHIDRLDEKGIFNYRSKEYTHKLRIIKRIL